METDNTLVGSGVVGDPLGVAISQEQGNAIIPLHDGLIVDNTEIIQDIDFLKEQVKQKWGLGPYGLAGDLLLFLSANTNEKQSIFSDPELNTDMQNPQVLNQSGFPSDGQVFLGMGDYTVRLYRPLETGHVYDENNPEELTENYSEIRSWFIDNSSTDKANQIKIVDNIDELKSIVGMGNGDIVGVRGWESARDNCPFRFFVYDQYSGLNPDDGLAVRPYGMEYSAWVHSPEGDVLDASLWGVVSGDYDCGVRLEKASNTCHSLGKKLFIGIGTYRLEKNTSLYCDVVLPSNQIKSLRQVQFYSPNSTYFNFHGLLENENKFSIAQNIKLIFRNENQRVYLEWFEAPQDCFTSVQKGTLVYSGDDLITINPVANSFWQGLEVNKKIIVAGQGQIKLAAGATIKTSQWDLSRSNITVPDGDGKLIVDENVVFSQGSFSYLSMGFSKIISTSGTIRFTGSTEVSLPPASVTLQGLELFAVENPNVSFVWKLDGKYFRKNSDAEIIGYVANTSDEELTNIKCSQIFNLPDSIWRLNNCNIAIKIDIGTRVNVLYISDCFMMIENTNSNNEALATDLSINNSSVVFIGHSIRAGERIRFNKSIISGTTLTLHYIDCVITNCDITDLYINKVATATTIHNLVIENNRWKTLNKTGKWSAIDTWTGLDMGDGALRVVNNSPAHPARATGVDHTGVYVPTTHWRGVHKQTDSSGAKISSATINSSGEPGFFSPLGVTEIKGRAAMRRWDDGNWSPDVAAQFAQYTNSSSAQLNFENFYPTGDVFFDIDLDVGV